MSGTVETITQLLTEFPVSGPAGGITPVNIQNVIATLKSLTGGVFTPEQFGAVGNGVTNDTAAFAAALSAAGGSAAVIVGPKKYVVGNLTIPNGGVLVGMYGYSTYDNSAAPGASPMRPQLIAPAGAIDILNISTAKFSSIANILLDGNGTGANGISDGAATSWNNFSDLNIVNCNWGMGGSRVSGFVGGRFLNIEVGSCAWGMVSPNDAQVNNCDFSANSSGGLLVTNGTGASSYTNCRFEWNGGPGVQISGGNDMTFAGCWADSNNGPAFLFDSGALSISVAGLNTRFNGATGGSGNRSHFVFNTCTDIVITGTSARSGTTPLYCIEWQGGATVNNHIVLCGNNFSRFVTAASVGTAPSANYRSSGNLGLADVNV